MPFFAYRYLTFVIISFDNLEDIQIDLDNISVAQSATCMIEDCGRIASLHKKSTSLLCQNIRSINKNYDSLTTLLARSKSRWDLIILTECWLYKSPPLPLMHGYTSAATNLHRSQNEGVVIFYRSHLQASVSEPLIQDANCLLLKLNNDTVVIAIYRSPAVPGFTKRPHEICLQL